MIIASKSNNSSKKPKNKIPTLNPQIMEATKKRILTMLNSKISNKGSDIESTNMTISLNKCNSSSTLINGLINQSSMFSLKTQSARTGIDLSCIVN